MMSDIKEKMISLWPRTWDQKHNTLRMRTIEIVASELTGDDWKRYNRIVEAVEKDDYEMFSLNVFPQE